MEQAQVLNEKRILGMFGKRSPEQVQNLKDKYETHKLKFERSKDLKAMSKEGGIGKLPETVGHGIAKGYHKGKANRLASTIKKENVKANYQQKLDDIKAKQKAPDAPKPQKEDKVDDIK
jgi:hypothetical protein